MGAFDLPRSRVDVEQLLTERQWVQRLARSLVADPNQADDVAQESWLAALRHPPRHDANLKSWLSRLVRNTAAGLRRGDTRRSERERSAVQPAATASSSDALERAEVVRELVDAVLALDRPRREALVLVYFEGLEPNVAADQLGMPHSTFRTHVRRGLAEIREKLERKRGREGWLPALTVLACRPEVPVVGVTFMSAKVVVAAAAVLILAICMWIGIRSAPETSVAHSQTSAPVELEATPVTPAPLEPTNAAPARTAATAVPAPTTGTIVVEARWAAKDRAAAALRVMLGRGDDEWRLHASASTDDSGRATFANVPPGPVVVTIDRGFEAEARAVAGETTIVRALLPDGVRVRGTVVDTQDAPVPNADIFLGVRGPHLQFGERTCSSDASGVFEIDSVAPGRLILARRAGWAPSFTHEVRASKSGVCELILRLPGPGCELVGHVRDEAGTPLEAAEISLLSVDVVPQVVDGTPAFRAPKATASTDARGEFVLRDLAPGLVLAVVRKPGFGTLNKMIELSRGSNTAELVLSHGTLVFGVVRDAAGKPASGAKVHTTGLETRSGPDGSFRLHDVLPGRRVLNVDAGNAGRVTTETAVPAAPEFEWNPRVDGGLKVEGRLVNAQDQPLADFWVRWEPRDNPFDERLVVSIQSSAGMRTRTDSEGRFVLPNCLDQTYRVRFGLPGEFAGLNVLTLDNVRPGKSDLVVRFDPSTFEEVRVHGRVVDEAGAPVAAEACLIEPFEKGTVKAACTETDDRSGAFEIEHVPAGKYEFTIAARGFVELHETRTIGRDTADCGTIRLARAGSLVVQLPEKETWMMRRGGLRLRVLTAPPRDLVLVGDLARIDGLPAGTWSLEALSSFGAPEGKPLAIEVQAGVTTRVEFDPGIAGSPK